MTDRFSIEAYAGISSYEMKALTTASDCVNRMHVLIEFQACIDIKWNLKWANSKELT